MSVREARMHCNAATFVSACALASMILCAALCLATLMPIEQHIIGPLEGGWHQERHNHWPSLPLLPFSVQMLTGEMANAAAATAGWVTRSCRSRCQLA
jgi:hypothetical protein